MTPREHRFQVGNIGLHYAEWGDAGRPPMLLVHGWDGTARYWDLVAPAFRDDYHVVAPTLRGRGLSDDDPTGEYRFDGYVRELREMTTGLGFERLVYVGASLGGLVGLPYAAAFPEQVERLVLVDIGARLGGDRPSSYYTGMMEAPDTFRDAVEAERWLRQWSLYDRLPAEGMAIVLREHFLERGDGSLQWRFGHKLRAALSRVPREQLFPSQWDVLGEVRCPVLIVHGTRSESLLAPVAERTRDALPEAHVVEIPGCSHLPHLEAHERLIRAVREFL